ncbi:hypothetical protein Ahy_A05g024952 isoform A [Arachis hypogaea]|uniref:N-acetyltransferase domain-containing protein n=1 Tax=Arachis hypogaea TaxID=3818 RepID=A0A445D7U6_ARAHY|nr:hypothetical protein Ahy_A05g024952 isoform A [Arachis hypogaea]
MSEGVSCKEESKSIDLTRITLRETDLSDVEDHMVWSSDEKVTEFCTWGPYTSKEEAIDFINGIPNIFSWYRAICLDNQAIGSVSVCLQRDRYREKVAEVGYILASEYWGKGIVTHVLKQVVKIVFSMYPQVERLEALTDNENLASQRVLEKAGFQREGVLRNYVYVKGKSRDVAIYNAIDLSQLCLSEPEVIDLTQLSLRPLGLSDLDDLMVWTSDEKVANFCSWEPYTSKDQGIDFIENAAASFLWRRAICLNDRAIGCITLSSYAAFDKAREKSVELGYVLGSNYWGKGIVTEAVKQAIKAAFIEFPYLDRVEALVDVENLGSQRVLEKAGFQREGLLRKYLVRKGKSRDTFMFSVLLSDLHPQL